MKRKYLVLSSNPESQSTQRILEEGRDKGHDMVAALPSDFCIHLGNKGEFRITAKTEEKAGKYHGVIPRGVGSDYGLALLNVFVQLGTPTANSANGIHTASNKLQCQIILTKHNLRQPKVTSIWGPDLGFKALVDSVNGLPCVAKPWHGSQGDGINIFMNEYQSSICLSNMRKAETKVILQQFIETSKDDKKKSDLRLFVIDGEVVAAYKRYSTDDDFRSNYSLSKHGEKTEVTEEETEMAITAAKVIGLGISGIDIARNAENEKPYIIEANSSPGLTGVEAVTGVNVARLIIDFMDRIADSLEPTTPRNGEEPNAIQSFFKYSGSSDNKKAQIMSALNMIGSRLNNLSSKIDINKMALQKVKSEQEVLDHSDFVDHHNNY